MSILLDRGARDLLARAYARPGVWQGTRLAAPTLRHQVWARQQGIEPYQRDRWGLQRWPRAFKRAIYYQHKWYYRPGRGLLASRRMTENRTLALQVQIGKRGFFGGESGWPVRVRTRPGGLTAARAVAARPSASYVENDQLQSTFADRDYPTN